MTTSRMTRQRYPDDQYDRFWSTDEAHPLSTNISTQTTIQPSTEFAVPSPVLQKAIVPSGNSMKLVFFSGQVDVLLRNHFVILHFADFQNNKSREFTVSIDNGVHSSPYSTPYLNGLSVTGSWSSDSEGKYNFTIAATAISALPPILNAYEVYGRIVHDNPTTFSQDFDAIMAIKYEYGIKKNWMGDPCFPHEYVWDGVKCSDAGDKIMRIISLDLSNSELHGSISNSFTLFTALKYLYYTTGRLTESSDVYSFGIVLLEITTGEPPIIPEKGHIVQRVKKKIVSGNISSVADAHLGGAYNVSSMWKVVNIAMMCTTDIATQRPKMADVVVQLKESLDLVEVQGDRGDKENLASDTMSSMSTFGPSAR
ncbi:hypothetical protein OsJ_29016 [Oryza sativa Japonica Group]|uniref:Malectin-like domain-containing protein n=1 Tax=Oryza sativa subsp. japonica TaxID=39947 RepID=B9G343_ORYSJ|nr:hypothetical protein OsJ_29016 [Oryza sativa Japonica Group]